ncbi:DUF2513 domain-containing protein [Agrobacterium tumefaciens]|uniref:DUF2513 domain-containing protein n=1 Tax=Agrobacterium tumefaciens TaxID=358 RepID=UPI003B9F7019
MTRDMALVRELLLRLETTEIEGPGGLLLTGSSPEVAVEGYRDNVIHYHLHLLDDAGFLMPLRIKKQPSISVTFRGLSWSGHEFLDSVRRKDVWDHTNAILKKAGGGTFEIAKAVAVAYISEQLSSQFGIALKK